MGGIHTDSKCATARKTTIDTDIAICLVNFYRDLWEGALKSLYARTLTTTTQMFPLPLSALCMSSSVVQAILNSVEPVRVGKFLDLINCKCLYGHGGQMGEFLCPWMSPLSLSTRSFFIISTWSKVLRGYLYIFTAFIFSRWQIYPQSLRKLQMLA